MASSLFSGNVVRMKDEPSSELQDVPGKHTHTGDHEQGKQMSLCNTRDINETSAKMQMHPNTVVEYFASPRFKEYARRCWVKLDGAPNGTPLSGEEIDEIKSHLQALVTINLTKPLIKSGNIKATLLSLQNGHETVKFNFPKEIIAPAKLAFAKHDADGWGNPVAPQDADNRLSSSSDAVYLSAPASQNARTITTSLINSRSKSSRNTATNISSSPPANHPIWGAKGIMRGLIADHSGRKVSTKLDPHYPYEVRSAKCFGHNGLAVGRWWPRQLAALRDGAHGATIAGIYGSNTDGVYSIVVSSAYEKVDNDLGDVIYYSSPKSTTNTDPNTFSSPEKIDAMELSFANKHNIRVLRSRGAGWEGAPVCGLRYDGLYSISASETKLNANGGRYVRWRLERRGGQPPLDAVRGHPTRKERRQEERINDYY